MSDLAIIIVSYNTKADLHACLSSLTATPPAVSHEILVVDNASSDGSAQLIRNTWPEVALVEAEANLGFASAVNRGLTQTDSSLVLLLNPDTAVHAGAVDRLVAVLKQDSASAVVGPRLVDDEGQLEISFGAMLTPLAELWQKLLVAGHARRLAPFSWLARRQAARRRYVDWVSGACLLVSRAALDAVGGLDERFFLYTEDVDLCASIRARGRRVVFAPEIEIRHRRGRARQHNPERAQQAYRRSHLAFYAKHHPRYHILLRLYLWLRGQLPPPQESGF